MLKIQLLKTCLGWKSTWNFEGFEFFAQLHANALILFLVEYQRFFLWNKGSCQLGALKDGHEKIRFAINERLKMQLCYFWCFRFSSLISLYHFCKKSYEKKKQKTKNKKQKTTTQTHNVYLESSSTSQNLLFWKPSIVKSRLFDFFFKFEWKAIILTGSFR